MKKLLLASAVAALSVSVSAANAAPTVYGKAFVTANYVDAELDGQSMDNTSNVNEDNSSVQVSSHSSRIGFKGSEAMTANTDVIYQLEYGIAIDGSDRNFKSRDTYLGFANKDLGEFRFGRNYSVTDYINNVSVNEGYWDNIGSSSLDVDSNDNDTLSEALTLTDGGRVDNSIVWIAPKYNNLPLELALQYSADEAFVSDNNDRDSGFGASLMFDQGTGYTAGVAYDKDMSITGGEILRGSASVDLSKYVAYPVTLGALYQQVDFDSGDDEEKGLVVSAEMGLSNFARPASVYLQYDKTDNLGGVNSNDSDQIVLGGKYMFKKNIIAHAYAGYNSADLESDLVVENNDNTPDTLFARGDADVFAIGGGLEYKF
ncbi:porin [Psychrobacter sp. LV10R520-6]|uniref:porin n=1 Tax=Psychrobacter sp. LV10R520-6 TaxID=1415574 RepID=UPI0024C56AA8|nr:porin [Psychrobacter sp. LV10R520-6]SNT70325.1 Outer membrane protein (porin) [Psychrobacter sp. LV10R520-6]